MVLKVTLDDSEREYSPLESFLGKVYLDVMRDSNIEVKVKLTGEEHTESVGSSRRSRIVSRRKFLETRSILLHSGYTNAGFYEFPFKVTLPNDIPSTYAAEDGYVKYLLKAFVNQLGQEAETEVKVSSPINVNELKLDESLFRPSTHSEKMVVKKASCWCPQEEIEMKVQLETRVFLLGDVVNVRVNLTDSSNQLVNALNTRLLLIISTALSTLKAVTTKTYKCVAYSHVEGVVPDTRGSYFINLKIPPDFKLPNFKHCAYFRQCLVLEVTAVLLGSSNLKLEVDLVLAHTKESRIKSTPGISSEEIIEPLPRGMSDVWRSSSHNRSASVYARPPYPLVPMLPPYPINQDVLPQRRTSSLEMAPGRQPAPYPFDVPALSLSLPCLDKNGAKTQRPPYPLTASNPPYPVTESMPMPENLQVTCRWIGFDVPWSRSVLAGVTAPVLAPSPSQDGAVEPSASSHDVTGPSAPLFTDLITTTSEVVADPSVPLLGNLPSPSSETESESDFITPPPTYEEFLQSELEKKKRKEGRRRREPAL